MNKITLEQLIRETDALTYLNAMKTGLSELKEELSIIEDTRDYQNQAAERARKVIRRIDNNYRAVVKCTAKMYHPPEVTVNLGPLEGPAAALLEESEDDESTS